MYNAIHTLTTRSNNMFDELVAVAKEEGNGDLLDGLAIIGKDLGLYPLTVREAYVKFMNMGAMMFATV